MRSTFAALLIATTCSFSQAGVICNAVHALFDGCASIKEPVPVDFDVLKNVTNTWYTSHSTHSLWQGDNYCNETSYIASETARPGIEHQYFLKKRDVAQMKDAPRSEWHKIINHYVTDTENPGISYWKADVKIDLLDLWITAPETRSYALIIDPSPTPRWWAAYYCSRLDGGLFTGGFDIRTDHLPLEPDVVEYIKQSALLAGVPHYVMKNLEEAPYHGCVVKDADGVSYVYDGH